MEKPKNFLFAVQTLNKFDQLGGLRIRQADRYPGLRKSAVIRVFELKYPKNSTN